ncbi:MAG: ATP-dependent Clp protease proteolytic subunit [Caldiserica bacterium]|jgi:ClpP class serine protease|nr:ATP-dependent Clp protease proteolytic subunit [Caldisericota bacterium]MDH7562561.1 ATP-dependent Clp protease proteolytic subunit [Caldisericota bacterium]
MSAFDYLSLILWALLILALFVPLFRQRSLFFQRLKFIRKLEEKRNSRVITLIHRQEVLSFLGIPLFRYIDVEDSEQILRAIRMTPPEMPIDLILHTAGGLVLASEQIAHALKNHQSRVTVMVPHFAMSGGTMIALAADELLMDQNAVLGPVDPQLERGLGSMLPATSILKVLSQKPRDKIEDSTLVMADVASKAIKQVKNFIKWLISERVTSEEAERISSFLAEGEWTHDAPLTVEALSEIGISIKTELPEEVYRLMELYPPPPGRRPSVQYIPFPYERREPEKGK